MIYTQLYDWQKSLVDNLANKKSYGLFLDMGLGKTPISLALCEKNEVDNILIITLENKAIESEKVKGSWFYWITQIEKSYTLKNKQSSDFEKNNCYLVNYEWLYDRKTKSIKGGIPLRKNISSFIENSKGKKVAIIIDESHSIKNQSSIRTKCITKIYNSLKQYSETYLYLLTGTPFTGGYIDLYSQLKLLGRQGNKEQFKEDYCIMGNIRGLLGWQQPIVGYKNVDKLFDEIHKFAITINSKSVIDLPQQLFVEHYYKENVKMKLFTREHINKSLIEEEMKSRNLNEKITHNFFYRNIDYPNNRWIADTSGSFWLRARELSIGFQGNAQEFEMYDETRFNLLKDMLKNEPSNYILFYSFTPEFLKIFDICYELDYKIDVFNGEIKSTYFYDDFAKKNTDERFNDKDKRIMLCNWQSGSTGLNFQAYNKCIIFDLPVYRDWEQGLKRIHRIGQSNACIYHLFLQDCWLDKSMYQSIQEKKNYTNDTFKSDLTRVNSLLNKEE